MPLVWVTGNSGAGKSAVCALLRQRGHDAIDADWEGYNHWVDRVTGEVVTDPPYPAPPGWLDRYGWQISRPQVEALAARAGGATVFLCGSVENEDDVRDLFDVVVCLAIDLGTLLDRLANRTSNTFGAHPEELAAAVKDNDRYPAGATIVDGTQPLGVVADAVVRAAGR